MPELAEVYWFARRWRSGVGRRVARVEAAPSRVFRHEGADAVAVALAGRVLLSCASRGKWAAFRFSGDALLGVHLGMTGRLFAEEERAGAPRFFGDGEAWRSPRPEHDRLTLRCAGGESFVFNDPRMFGAVRLHLGAESPGWWRGAGPDPASPDWDAARVLAHRVWRGRSPVKAVALRQDLFPGIGNWMADELLFRARVRPDRPASTLCEPERAAVVGEARAVALGALATVGEGSPPPEDWLFHRRWRAGGVCPKTGCALARGPVGGRTSCWSPAWQA